MNVHEFFSNLHVNQKAWCRQWLKDAGYVMPCSIPGEVITNLVYAFAGARLRGEIEMPKKVYERNCVGIGHRYFYVDEMFWRIDDYEEHGAALTIEERLVHNKFIGATLPC